MQRRVIFRADGSSEIGYGHFIRTLGIAGLINSNFYCLFATRNPSLYQLDEVNKICKEVIILKDPDPLADEFLQFTAPGDIIVLDNYFFSSEYQLKIRARGCIVICIDDFNDKHYVCDALINNIPGFTENDFDREPYTNLYLGTDYALLRKEFFNASWRDFKKEENKIFISFGGSDKYNIGKKIVEYLFKIDENLEVNIIIGDGYKDLNSLSHFPKIRIHKNISADEIAAIIATARVCIVPASSLINEVSSIGSLLMIGYFVDNQINPYKYFVENRLAIGIGDYRVVTFDTFKERFHEVLNCSYLITNQHSLYHFQQEKNLQNIFCKYGNP